MPAPTFRGTTENSCLPPGRHTSFPSFSRTSNASRMVDIGLTSSRAFKNRSSGSAADEFSFQSHFFSSISEVRNVDVATPLRLRSDTRRALAGYMTRPVDHASATDPAKTPQRRYVRTADALEAFRSNFTSSQLGGDGCSHPINDSLRHRGIRALGAPAPLVRTRGVKIAAQVVQVETHHTGSVRTVCGR